MSLILAIEPDRRQAAKVYTLADSLRVELIHGETTETALAALGTRIPDLVLTSQLLSPKDESALADRLRELDAAGSHVPTLVIPTLRGEEGERKKKGGGLFGRLRRNKDEKTTEGCDPAVFGAEITEYLERAAAERAALAQAQADLEAAWAEAPAAPAAAATATTAAAAEALPAPPAVSGASNDADIQALFNQPSSYEPVDDVVQAATAEAAPTLGLHVDVHPGMEIDDPEALFGEFAAIPIRRPAETTTVDIDAEPSPLSFDEAPIVPSGESAVDELFAAAPAGEDVVHAPRAQAEEEWEEIALDATPATATREGTDAHAHEPHHELAHESVDLDAFVRELSTVRSTANAQPMIPIVDLSHVLAGDMPLPEPEIVSELQLREEERAEFDAEVAAVFATEPPITFEAEPELAEEPVIAAAADAATPQYDLHSLPLPAIDVPSIEAPPVDVPAVEMPTVELAAEPAAAKLWPEFPDLKMPTWQSPDTTPAAPERWRAALESLPAPTVATPTADVTVVREPALKPGWHDMLSAIRRDIDHVRKDEEAAAPVVKPKIDLSSEPLVFKKRSTVTASLISGIEPPKAFKQPLEAAPPPDPGAQAAALQKLLETVVVPKADPPAAGAAGPFDTAIADTVGNEAAALEAAISNINVGEVAATEKLEPRPDLTANPVWAGGPSLTASLVTAVDDTVLPADAISPEGAAPELQTVDLSWLSAPPTPAVIDTAPAALPESTLPVTAATETRSIDEMSLDELEWATRPDTATPEPAVETPVTSPTVREVEAREISAHEVARGVVEVHHAATQPVETHEEVAHEVEAQADTEWKADVEPEWKQKRGGKGKKRRKQAPAGKLAASALPRSSTSAPSKSVAPVDEDFGFFDPHMQGFLPLLARLNQITASGFPLR